MTLSGGDNGNLRFELAAYCWAKNVEATLWLNEGIAIDYSFRIQLEDFMSTTRSGRSLAAEATPSACRTGRPKR